MLLEFAILSSPKNVARKFHSHNDLLLNAQGMAVTQGEVGNRRSTTMVFHCSKADNENTFAQKD